MVLPTRCTSRRSRPRAPVRLVPLVLSCCSSRLATWLCVGGLQPGCHAHGGRGAGSASPPYPSGALHERYARKGGGTRWWVRGRTTTSGLHACTHAPGSAPHCCGSRCTAVGSVAATCLGQSSEASIEIGIARSSVSVSASAQGSGIFRHLGRFSAFFRLFGGILDPTDSD